MQSIYQVIIVLPLGPSLNTMYEVKRGARGPQLVLSDRARRYKATFQMQIRVAMSPYRSALASLTSQYLSTEVVAAVPHAGHDVDNVLKCLLDTLAPGFGFNDNQVTTLLVHKRIRGPAGPSWVLVSLKGLGARGADRPTWLRATGRPPGNRVVVTADGATLRLTLPLGPSVNQMYHATSSRQGKLRVELTPPARAYKAQVLPRLKVAVAPYQAVLSSLAGQYLEMGVTAAVPLTTAMQEQGHEYDADNVLKILLDTVATALGFNDNQVVTLLTSKRIVDHGQTPWVHIVLCGKGRRHKTGHPAWLRATTPPVPIGEVLVRGS